jgi:hypothetical protein
MTGTMILFVIAVIYNLFLLATVSDKNAEIDKFKAKDNSEKFNEFLENLKKEQELPHLVVMQEFDQEKVNKAVFGTYFIYPIDPTSESEDNMTENGKMPLRMMRKVRNPANPSLSMTILIGRLVTLKSRNKYVTNEIESYANVD